MTSQPVLVTGCNGPQFFGFGHPTVCALIECLPRAEECADYVFKYAIPSRETKTKAVVETREPTPNPSGACRSEGYTRQPQVSKLLYEPPPMHFDTVEVKEEEPKKRFKVRRCKSARHRVFWD